jgi:hypothetical protein
VKVVIDWDGTVTEDDTLSMALRRFVPAATLDPLTKRLDAALAAGQMTLQEVMNAEFGSLTAPLDAVVVFLLVHPGGWPRLAGVWERGDPQKKRKSFDFTK